MNYQELITETIIKLELSDTELANISINFPTKTITIIDSAFRKFVTPFPEPVEEDYNQDPPPRKRVKAVKKTV